MQRSRPRYYPLQEEEDIEKIAKEIEDRHKDYEAELEAEEAAEAGETSPHIKKQFLLPTVKDSKLWLIKCKVSI